MLMPTYSLRLGLLLCLSVLTPFAAHADKRSQIILRGKQASPTELVKVMKAQPAGTHLDLSVLPLPFFTRLLSLLPRGTKLAGNNFTLPNGSDYRIVNAMTEAEQEAEFLSHTETRHQLITRLKKLKGYWPNAIVKVKRPQDRAFMAVGTLEQGIQKTPLLPLGTYTIAVMPEKKATCRFYRIGERPTLPQPHRSLRPGLRWTVDENGNYEEVPTATRTGLHWVERPDGFWEEAPVSVAHGSHMSASRK